MSLVFSCQKQTQRPINVPDDYKGIWDANEKTFGGINIYYTIVIGSNGIGSYKKDGVFEDEEVEGEVFISGKSLKIKSTKFTINQSPERIEEGSHIWNMTVNNIKYRKN